MTQRTVQILLVDDDDVEAEAIERSFRRKKIANPITRARDGEEALCVLRARGSDAVIRRPWMVLLDLNMPRMNGFEFLEALRADPMLLDTVVFVLTTSSADEDMASAYEKHVAGYIVKSNVGSEFQALASMLDAYWRIVELPEERA
jgi:CheY-like chemotaxis protein